MPAISIVTVCYNASKTIENTLDSVYRQTFQDYEYIVVDGGSTDGTLDIVRKYENKFLHNSSSFKFISERDNGIYDAMNKGVELASGEWILFLNADDSLYSYDVLEKFYCFSQQNEADVIYGDCKMIKGTNWRIDIAGDDIDRIKNFKFFCHQSSFTRKRCFQDVRFNEKYKICADYDFFLKLYLKNSKFFHFNEVICNFSAEGISSQRYYQSILENYKIRVDNGLEKGGFVIYIKSLIWNIKHVLMNEL